VHASLRYNYLLLGISIIAVLRTYMRPGEWNLQHWKMTDEVAGMDNEIWKLADWKNDGLEND